MDKNIKKQPFVSVIMPVYNGEKFIREAIDSILNQTYKHFELIVIDDGSSDNSTKIISHYDSLDNRVVFLKNKINLGVSDTLNKGISYAKGKYIARMDCDDISSPNRIMEEVKLLENRRDISLCGSWGIAFNENNKNLFSLKSPTGILLKYNFWKPSPFISSSVMIRRSVIKNNKFRKQYNSVEDYDLWVRILKTKKGFNIKRTLIYYRINPKGISKTNPEKHDELSANVLRENFGLSNLSTRDYLSLSCLEFKMKTLNRFCLLMKFRKKLLLPIWFIIIDSLYYQYRKIIFSVSPELNKYRQ